MSHIATVNIEIKDLGAFDAACKRLGLELRRDVRQFRNFGGRMNQCDHVVHLNDEAYQMGLRKRKDGKGFDILHDPFADGRGMTLVVGANCEKLKQHYALAAARKQAMQQGFRVQGERTLQDGTMQLVLTR